MSTPTPDDPTPSASWWHRWTLSPRAAVLTGAVVVAVALVVVGVGAIGGPSSEDVTVTGAGTALSGAGGGAPAGRPAAADGEPGAGRSSPPSTSPPSGAPSSVAVYVLGAVGHAGVVQVPAGSRIEVVLERAGGPAADADLTRLNLARLAVDGERLYVPRVGEDVVPEALAPDTGGGGGSGTGGAGAGAVGGGAAGTSGPDAVVDLNTADQAALETLPGIGPSLAARIIAWRTEHGRFSSVEDLLDVSGIGDGRFAELRDRVRV
ncbi:ComEA family DNA-binding protein [Curtobacterium sp. MCBA15_004]|uniref:ComEA family DNA-binding protein n=1 Tax=unclassified Curtobacterium TaxID=257496 RepID=UPI0008DD76E3|nr:ComEA family DNA-binding protein [Curtobacterium sp. MCBA15_004]WIA98146.1 ComEA family DNA-binding protein [Curtobacterium sp. MCBA15_004]